MKVICPYCGTITTKPMLPPMKERQRRVYDAVASAGSVGVRVERLMAIMSSPRRPTPGANTVLRVMIHETNKLIAPMGQKIVSRRGRDERGRYFLVSTGGK